MANTNLCAEGPSKTRSGRPKSIYNTLVLCYNIPDTHHKKYGQARDKWNHDHDGFQSCYVDIYDFNINDVLDPAAFDDDTGDREDEMVRDNAMLQATKTQYEMMSETDMKRLLENDPYLKKSKNYHRGFINLVGDFDAICTISTGEEFDIKGRLNCGQTFSGDEVIIELVKTRDSTTGMNCTRGKVVYILKRMTNRTARTFVCMVDKNRSNVMRPLGGIVPQIHILDHAVRTKYKGLKRNNFVAVYDNNMDIKIQKLDPTKRQETVFVVKYLKWDSKCIFPHGYVCKVMRCQDSIKSSQKILNILYSIPEVDNKICVEFIENRLAAYTESYEISDENSDYRDVTTVTIDPPECRCQDDALSVKRLPGGDFEVGVHIVDVANFIKKDDFIDMEARRRGSTQNSIENESYQMFPSIISQDLLSLVEHKDRKTISVIFKMNSDSEVIGDPQVLTAVINVDKNLTYRNVQHIIDSTGQESDEVTSTVTDLHFLAKQMRRNRLNGGQYFYDIKNRGHNVLELLSNDQCYDAHRLVEEFMIFTNKEVAKYLLRKLPTCIPLRHQAGPAREKQENFKTHHKKVLPISFYFQQYSSLDLPPIAAIDIVSHRAPVIMLPEVFEVYQDSVETGNEKHARMIIGMESLHPQHENAMRDWHKFQKHAEYVCYNELDPGRHLTHFSLQDDYYVNFTSPLRRYIDTVTHRLVRAVICNSQLPYTEDEISDICRSASMRKRMVTNYRAHCNSVRFAHLPMFSSPRYMLCYINDFDAFGITLCIPNEQTRVLDMQSIRYSNLSVHGAPVRENDGSGVKLLWKKRLYDYAAIGSQIENARSRKNSNDEVCLDGEMHCKIVEGDYWWHNMQKIVLADTCHKELIYNKNSKSIEKTVKKKSRNVTSEMEVNTKIRNHFVMFSVSLNRGSLLSVQFTTRIPRGFFPPEPRLLNFALYKDLCIEHRQDPVPCFAKPATHKTVLLYRDKDHYRDIWLPLLKMEAATQAVRNEDTILCNNVPLKLEKRKDLYYGTLELDRQFCLDRKISLYSNDNGEATSDYMCIRYHRSSKNGVPQGGSDTDTVWVAHALLIGHVNMEKNPLIMQFRVFHYHNCPPIELLSATTVNHKCAIEFLTRSISDRRMAKAISSLSSKLCTTIALGHRLDDKADNNFKPPRPLADYSITTTSTNGRGGYLRNNDGQHNAIKEALRRQFTLIQGPPGTGKTLTGVKIVYWLNKTNREREQGTTPPIRKQILCCGPSNSAVDVTAGQLYTRLADQSLNIVRVYGETKEREDFPIPYDLHATKPRKKGKRLPKEICLHYIIRQKGKPYSEEILRYDNLFKRVIEYEENMDRGEDIVTEKPIEVSDKQIAAYHKLITDASVEELKNYDVILCTCSTSANMRLKNGTNIAQIIIDEAAMSMEPDSLVPIAHFKTANQVILLGDHMQLQPIVMNRDAKALGLNISLFERYAKHQPENIILLTEQYRMNAEICSFPSNNFYGNQLVTAPNTEWFNRVDHNLKTFWPREFVPMVFCHVEGIERTQPVATAEGHENSKCNEEERKHVTRIVRKLLKRIKNKYEPENDALKNVAVLTQYNAQRAAIEDDFRLRNLQGINVRTVVASQGDEWDYVILSTVRSLPDYELDPYASRGWCQSKLGFVADDHQINVAITRAKQGLIIIGNKKLLRCCNMWENLLNWYEERGCVVNAENFPRPLTKKKVKL